MSRAPKLTLNLQFPAAKAWPEHKALLPRATVAGWIKAALFADGELTVRFVDAEEGRTLNRTYRGKDYSTNVLTFAYDPLPGRLTLKLLVKLPRVLICLPMFRAECGYAFTPPVFGWSAQTPQLLYELAQIVCGPAPLPQTSLRTV